LYYQLLSWKTFSTPCGGEKISQTRIAPCMTIQRVNILKIQTIFRAILVLVSPISSGDNPEML
ncbi:hypothetical protein ACVWBO_00360, partial [Escherichia coli]